MYNDVFNAVCEIKSILTYYQQQKEEIIISIIIVIKTPIVVTYFLFILREHPQIGKYGKQIII